jgi:hypothetical protein
MKKSTTQHDRRPLALRKQIILHLDQDQLKDVIGGNNSTRPSQCVTLCF